MKKWVTNYDWLGTQDVTNSDLLGEYRHNCGEEQPQINISQTTTTAAAVAMWYGQACLGTTFPQL
jgi:hypothetical protein